VLVAGLIAAGAPARGEPRRSAAATEKAARTHLGAADRAFQRGEYDGALAEVQAAYAIDPRPEYLIVFAQVYRAKGDPQQAVNACELYLATAPQGPRASEARGLAEAARAELEKKRVPPPETGPPVEPAAVPPPAPPIVVAAPPPPPPPPPPQRRHRHVGVWIGVSAAVVTVGVALGVGLGLGLQRGPQTIWFDPGR
jgi:hypothetical protein